MSNNKQIMKLYTEEQVKHIFENLNISSGYDYNMELYCSSITPIELPSDEEIREWAEMQSLGEPTGVEEFGRIYGAKWMRDKIQGGDK